MRVFSIDELAKAFGVSRSTLFRLRKSGKGPKSIRIGRSVRYLAEDVIAWAKAQNIQPPVKRINSGLRKFEDPLKDLF